MFVLWDWLKISVRALMAIGPRFFKCRLLIPSGPHARELEAVWMVLDTWNGRNGSFWV